MKPFKEWYQEIKEMASVEAGVDHSSEDAVKKVKDSKKKHEDDFEADGAGKVDVPEAGK